MSSEMTMAYCLAPKTKMLSAKVKLNLALTFISSFSFTVILIKVTVTQMLDNLRCIYDLKDHKKKE